jgi:hypothetical protein
MSVRDPVAIAERRATSTGLDRRSTDTGVRVASEFAAYTRLERGGIALLPTAADFHRLTEP